MGEAPASFPCSGLQAGGVQPTMSWVYGAVLVAVIAMTVTEGLSEEADLGALVDKWAYIPEVPTEGDRQKKAMELVQKNAKGRWVNVPVGQTAEDVLRKEELLKAKILADAQKARHAAELSKKAKKKEERTQKRVLNADQEKDAIVKDLKKENLALASVKSALKGNSDFDSLNENMMNRKKITEKIDKLNAQKQELDALLAKYDAKLEKRKKKVIKDVEIDSKKKAEAQELKVKKMMELASSGEE